MSNDQTEKRLVLSAAEVRRWRVECGEIDRQVEALGMRKAALLKKIEAAELLAPSLLEDQPRQAGEGQAKVIRERKGRATWTSVIEELVRDSGSGIRQRQALEEMRRGLYGERLKSSESGFYNGVAKLLKRDILKKRGEYLFTPAQYDEYLRKVERGEIPDYADEDEYRSPVAAAVMRVARSHPGLKSDALIREVWDAYDAQEEQRPAKGSLYNAIARLVDQKHLRREEKRFYPCETNEASSEPPEDASETGEEASLDLSTRDEKVTSLFRR